MLPDSAYLRIDLERTGRHLEKLIRQRGYSVKYIQRILHLSCPQPIYRWMRGQILPSVDHLFMLARLLHVHMEDLLIPSYEAPEDMAEEQRSRVRRMIAYCLEYLRIRAA